MKQIAKTKKLLSSNKVVTWRTLFNTYRSLFSYFETQLSENGCTVPRFQILLHLYLDGPLTPINLSKILDVSRANITTFLKRLQEDQLITPTEEKGTKRRPAWELTKKGIKSFEEILPAHVKNVEEVVTPLPKNALKILNNMNERIKNKR